MTSYEFEIENYPHEQLLNLKMAEEILQPIPNPFIEYVPEAKPLFINGFKSISHLFPHKIAIKDYSHQISYQELDQLSDQLAHYFLEQGCQQYNKLAVIGTRKIELVIIILAAFKCGMVISILDPKYPAEYLENCISIMN